MPETGFWLYEWIDSYLIKSPQQASNVLRQPAARRALQEMAAEVRYALPAVEPDQSVIVAGAGLDLSGRLDCLNPACIIGQVNKLFRSVWHYFDKIVVVGPSALWITELFEGEDEDESEVLDIVSGYIQVLLYLRNIGAEDLLVFTEKPGTWCQHHFTQLVEEVGFSSSDALDAYTADMTLSS